MVTSSYYIETASYYISFSVKSLNSPEKLAQQLYLHEREIRETRGENIIFKNQVPPTYSDLVLRNYMRTSILPDLVFRVFSEMNRVHKVFKDCTTLEKVL